MPTIPEEDEPMDEFVNWHHADPAVGGLAMGADAVGVDDDPSLSTLFATTGATATTTTTSAPAAEADLALMMEAAEGDEFSFWALEHYEPTSLATVGAARASTLSVPFLGDMSSPILEDIGRPEWPETSCSNCQVGGYSCKRINEGMYKGYCTSCVALGYECSFGFASALADGPAPYSALPANPWPTMGDHPNSIDQLCDLDPDLSRSSTSIRPHSTDCETVGLQTLTNLLEQQKQQQQNTQERIQSARDAKPAPKVGARFSRESVKVLKNWLQTHTRHPYPSEDEKESLQRLTGLNKVQITNWLANARRRGKILPPRSTSPHPGNWSCPIDIPQRRGTPSPLDGGYRRGSSLAHMNPLQRWANSPPENEPASVTDICRAITSSSPHTSSGLDSPATFTYTDDGSARSQQDLASSASSVGTSHSSGGSFASAYSSGHNSHKSFASFGSFGGRARRRRRRRAPPTKGTDGTANTEKKSLAVPLKTFQCTFCTETFRTKHDWQRHEKTLHLSLERWVCAPKGPTAINPETKLLSCVFCGEENPDEAHVEGHNFSACQERTQADKTFYRKDHLRQHLKLVHNVKFVNWSMASWTAATPEIRSRCGFCGIVMDTWTTRVDHLAEHFKTGNSMADWKGDWGFDAPVLELVENSIPPYLIHDERNSPLPFEASQGALETPRNAYELLRSELYYWLRHRRDLGHYPTDDEMQVEACRIIYASELLAENPNSGAAAPSWTRDLIMSSEEISNQARMLPIRTHNDSHMAILKIKGKDNLFEACPLERQLLDFVTARRMLGLTAIDSELQIEACHIIGRIEESSNSASDDIANFLLRLIYSSKSWLADFRARAYLPRSEDMADEGNRSDDPTKIDSTIHNYSRLETELAQFVRTQRALGIEPDDASLQLQARIIVYEHEDPWNQTAADSAEWLAAFKQRHVSTISTGSSPTNSAPTLLSVGASSSTSNPPELAPQCSMSVTCTVAQNPVMGSGSGTDLIKPMAFFFNDANCYRRLARELYRWINAITSVNNPNRHVPTDEEIQHQARWILYDDDDPWNQTAADNAEWLQRFKRDAGILPADGPGLPSGLGWSVQQGGSGFAPPYIFPRAVPEPFAAPVPISIVPALGVAHYVDVPAVDQGVVPVFEATSATANRYLQSFRQRYDRPAVVFCSRELEAGLLAFVEGKVAGKGVFPSDEALRTKAREVLGMQPGQETAADDEELLEKFKEMVRRKMALQGQNFMEGMPIAASQTQAEENRGLGAGLSGHLGMNFNMTERELQNVMQDIGLDLGGEMDMDFGDGGASLNF